MSDVDASFVQLFEVINRVTGSRVPLRILPTLPFRLAARRYRGCAVERLRA